MPKIKPALLIRKRQSGTVRETEKRGEREREKEKREQADHNKAIHAAEARCICVLRYELHKIQKLISKITKNKNKPQKAQDSVTGCC